MVTRLSLILRSQLHSLFLSPPPPPFISFSFEGRGKGTGHLRQVNVVAESKVVEQYLHLNFWQQRILHPAGVAGGFRCERVKSI